MSGERQRYIPSMASVKEAAAALPPVETWRAGTFSVPLENNKTIEFRKIPFKSNGRKTHRWVYDGKIMVR